jgi:hypothetical protein
MCDVLLPPRVNPTAVKYISYHNSGHEYYCFVYLDMVTVNVVKIRSFGEKCYPHFQEVDGCIKVLHLNTLSLPSQLHRIHLDGRQVSGDGSTCSYSQ